MSENEKLAIASITPTLTVDDAAVSVAFYKDILGFEVSEQFTDPEGNVVAASMRAGDSSIFLGKDDWARGRDRSKGIGVRLYIEVTTDIDSLAAGIKERGGVLDHDLTDRSWGSRDFAVTDPSGFKLSFSTPFNSEGSSST